MMNLFTNFNTSMELFNLPLKWMSILMIMMLMPNKFWLIPSRMEMLIIKTMKILPLKFSYFIPMIMFMAMMNWLSVTPYIFSPSFQALMIFSIAFPMWLATEINRTMNNISLRISNLLPPFTPLYLIPLMVPVEIVSLIIRPFTLTLRLCINVTASSLMTALITIGSFNIPLVIFPQMIFQIMELGSLFIQATVFVFLINLYQKA
uniref:ATP synthase subunit a n=1 Tax=Nymphon gracile TaxID=136195 RepID=A0MG53_NYMGR|nr:ATP synthase F0 subunit 6 [Nymphon gracile]ABF93285.1 ATP synthase F0 subunit 6 [Nymphon gracile]